jgi:tetratricopeptide (TPR) repeat protein
MAGAILEGERPDFLAVYLEGIDSVSHLFVRDPVRGPRAIEAAYRDADALLARLAASAPPDTWIVVCSDHGFAPADAGLDEDPADLAGPASAWHRPYGLVAAIEARALRGEGPAKPSAIGAVTPLDVAPTLLHLAGLPVSAEMPGRVALELLPQDAVARPVRRVATFEHPGSRPEPAARGAVDADVVARLQALGYVGATPSSLARQNLGEILYRRGNLGSAERELRAVVDAQPGNLTAQLWLAKTFRAQAHPRAALAVYERVLALPGAPRTALVEAADLAAAAGLVEEGRRIVNGVKSSADHAAALHTARGILADAGGSRAEGERAYRSALAADPLCFEALWRVADLLIAAGRPRDGLSLAREAVRRAPGSPRHAAVLGEILLASGDAAGAETALSRALALAPDAEPVRLDLARAQLAAGLAERALATLATGPASRQRSVLVGAARSQQGDWAAAAQAYGEALEAGEATPQLLNGLAWAVLKLGKDDEAARLLYRSLSIEKNQPEMTRLLAEIRGGLRR